MVTLKDARIVADSIVEAMHPVSVVLFGSVARYGAGEDLDLLVITDDKSKREGSPDILLHKCLKRFVRRFAIDRFILSVSLLKKYYYQGSPFLRMIYKEGKGLYMKGAEQEWIKQAGEELDTAEYLLKGGYFKGACYHSQQSAEKSIKSKLFKKGWELEKTHSIGRLIAIAKDYKVRLDLSEEDIIFLDSIYRGRYPIEAGLLPLGEPREKDAERAVDIARRCAIK